MTVTVSAQVGHQDVDVAEFLDHVKVIYVTPADLVANVFRVGVPLGSILLEVRAMILTAFDVATTLTVGDTGNANGYLATADTAVGTIGSMAQSSDKANTYQSGRGYLTTPGIVVATFNGTPTVGKLRLDLVFAGKDEIAKPRDMINNW